MKKTTPQQQHEEAKHEEVKAVNTEKNEKFSHQKQWDYRHTTKRIASSLSEALILFKMKT